MGNLAKMQPFNPFIEQNDLNKELFILLKEI